MNIVESVKTVLFRKYAIFEGRASRSEFWWFSLFHFLVVTVLGFIQGFVVGAALGAYYAVAMSSSPERITDILLTIAQRGAIFPFVINALLFIPYMAVMARRLHDKNISGHFLWPIAVVWISQIVLSAIFLVNIEFILSLGSLPVYMNGVMMLLSLAVIVFAVQAGTRGANKYGADPLRLTEASVFA